MNRRRILMMISALVVLLIFVVLWTHLHKKTQAPKTQTAAAIVVKTVQVSPQKMPNTLDAIGTLRAKQQSNISSDVSGKVVRMDYQPGRFVKKGDPLIQLDDRIYRANVKSAESELTLAKADYQRYSKLAKAGAQSRQMLDQARAKLLQAEANVSSQQTQLKETTIRAPFDGYVGPRTVSVGDYVQAGQTLTVLVDRHQLEVDYSLPEQYLPKLKLGQSVKVHLDQHKKSFHGKLSYMAPNIDVNTHSIALAADIPNPNNELTPGLFVKVRHDIGNNNQALAIPLAAIIPTIEGAKVFVVEKEKAYSRPVVTGVTHKNSIEIIKGIKRDERVVVAGQEQLKNGSAVKEVR